MAACLCQDIVSLSDEQYILLQINDPNGPVFYEGKYHV